MAERFPSLRSWVMCLLGGFLIFAAGENLKTYFVDQAGDYDCWKYFSIEATTVGKTVVQRKDTVFYLAPAFYHHFTVQYLDYFESKRVHLLDLSRMNHQPLDNSLSRVCFVLDEGKSPTLEFLKSLYPNGQEEPFKDRNGKTLAFFYYIPGSAQPLSFQKGLEKWEFANGHKSLFESYTFLWDPLINFTNISDLGVSHPPVWIVWGGKILAPTAGTYRFIILTQDEGELSLDGRSIVNTEHSQEGTVTLAAGWHSLELTCQRENKPDVALDFHLLWKKPGDKAYQIVPNGAFGMIR